MTQQETNATKLTQAEAQAKLFEAAKTGNIDAAKAALAAGANLWAKNDEGDGVREIATHSGNRKLIHYLNTKRRELMDEREIEENVFVNRVLAGIVAIGIPFLFWVALRSPSTPDLPPKGAATVRDNTEAQKALRTMLQDPDLADRIIKQMKDPSFTDTLTSDPKIMQNLQKVAAAIAENADKARIGELEQNRGEDESARKNWTDKATQEQGKAVGSHTGRN